MPTTFCCSARGASAKTVLTDDSPLRIEVPQDREGSFEPLLIPKHERRFTSFDDKILAMYARGMTVRETQAFLREQTDTTDTTGCRRGSRMIRSKRNSRRRSEIFLAK